jgi:hypothetical protein
MSKSIAGIVKDGVVIPDEPLPEGAHVQIQLGEPTPEVTPELRSEFEEWGRASAESLELVERMAQEMEDDEKR